jgi:exodeoxyribonuclease VII small subunit
MKSKTATFEEKIAKIEEILDLLDGGDIPLDEMLRNYEEGMLLVKECRSFLEAAEQKIIEIGGLAQDDGI